MFSKLPGVKSKRRFMHVSRDMSQVYGPDSQWSNSPSKLELPAATTVVIAAAVAAAAVTVDVAVTIAAAAVIAALSAPGDSTRTT